MAGADHYSALTRRGDKCPQGLEMLSGINNNSVFWGKNPSFPQARMEKSKTNGAEEMSKDK